MIIHTGYIRLITIEGGGFDKGKPVRPSIVESESVPANILATQHRVYDTGSQAWITKQGYSILVDAATPGADTAKRVSIITGRGQKLGEFEVQEIKCLDYVEAIQFTI